MSASVGIIGAGIAGLTLGVRLVAEGHSIVVLDKGRGVGGRTSTRRGEGIAFDHGAQYFTIRDPGFREFLDRHTPNGVVQPWEGRFASFEGGNLIPETPRQPRLVGVPGMNSIAQSIAEGLETRTQTRVVGLAGSPGRWMLVDSDGREHGPFDWVVATAPPAQSAALFSGLSPIADEIRRVAMLPCFALMIAPEGGVALPADGIQCNHPILGWAANDHSKPGRGPGPALVIQSNHDWALAHVDDDSSAVARMLREAASAAFEVDLRSVKSESMHRWLYAKPAESLGRPYLLDPASRLGSCGDWCQAAKVEGAYLSGFACAAAMIQLSGT